MLHLVMKNILPSIFLIKGSPQFCCLKNYKFLVLLERTSWPFIYRKANSAFLRESGQLELFGRTNCSQNLWENLENDLCSDTSFKNFT